MKNLILLLILAACGYVAWDFYYGPYDMPVHTTLKNKEGVSIEAIIVNKTPTHVDIIARDDNKIYNLPQNSLDLYSRYQVIRSRVGSAAGNSANMQGGASSSSTSERDSIYIANLERLHKDNLKKVKQLEIAGVQEIQGNNGKQTGRYNQIQRDIEHLSRENELIRMRIGAINLEGAN